MERVEKERTEKLPIVYIVILNWNGFENTIECLESNYSSNYKNFEVVVVDNGSTDDSVLKIKRWARDNGIKLKTEISLIDGKTEQIKKLDIPFIPSALTIIKTNKNFGFSRGNNFGIKYALANGAEYIFLLNNDIVLNPKTLETLLTSIQSDEKIGAVFPKIIGEKGNLQVTVELRPPFNFWEVLLAGNNLRFLGSYFDYRLYLKRKSPYKEYRYDQLISLPNIVVAGALYRRKFFEDVGLLDENIFMYHEEDILVEKLKRTNYIFCFNPFTEVIHKVGGDTRKLPSPFLYIESCRSEIYCGKNYKHLRKWQIRLLKFFRTLYYLYYMGKSKEYRKYLPDFLWRYLFWKIPLVNGIPQEKRKA